MRIIREYPHFCSKHFLAEKGSASLTVQPPRICLSAEARGSRQLWRVLALPLAGRVCGSGWWHRVPAAGGAESAGSSGASGPASPEARSKPGGRWCDLSTRRAGKGGEGASCPWAAP